MAQTVIDYDRFRSSKRLRLAVSAAIGARRGTRNRPRDAAERASLLRLDLARLRRMYATGERRWTGPRSMVVRLTSR